MIGSHQAPHAGFRTNCGASDPLTLTGDGIGALQVGVPVSELAAKCVVLSDTVAFDDEALPQRVMTVLLSSADTVRAMVESELLWRLEIASPRIRTRDSLGVGSSLSALLKFPHAQVRGLEGEGQLFVIIEPHCGLSFRINIELNSEEHRTDWSATDLAALNGAAPVDQVLVVGCGTTTSLWNP